MLVQGEKMQVVSSVQECKSDCELPNVPDLNSFDGPTVNVH